MKNVPQYIIDFLKATKEARVNGFGVFTIKSSGAQLDAQKKSILPPSEFVDFTQDFTLQDDKIWQNIAADRNISLENALHELQTQVDFWKKKHAAREEFTIVGIGDFVKKDQQLIFEGQKWYADTPDFFGLEEIVFSEIQSKKEEHTIPVNDSSGDYRFSKNVLWLFLLVLPLLALAYYAFTNQELLFGKKSFQDISVKNATHRIPSAKMPAVPVPVQDSLKVDSTQIAP